MKSSELHTKYMRMALREAAKARKIDEVPVGAVAVLDGKVIGRGHNRPVSKSDPSSHAEINALRRAGRKTGNYRLTGASIYTTLEPCPMCAGALVNARVKEVFFGCRDSRAGACGSVMNIASSRKLNHRVRVTGGIMEDSCRRVIQDFFRKKRKGNGGRKTAE